MARKLRALSIVVSGVFGSVFGLAVAPPCAADGTLTHDGHPVSVAGAEQWALRPTKVSVAAVPPKPERGRPLAELPSERRAVRVIYQGYQGYVPDPQVTGSH